MPQLRFILVSCPVLFHILQCFAKVLSVIHQEGL